MLCYFSPYIFSANFSAFVTNINASISYNIANIRDVVPNFYSYNYDRGTQGTSISDGGSDMYDGGNQASTTKHI